MNGRYHRPVRGGRSWRAGLLWLSLTPLLHVGRTDAAQPPAVAARRGAKTTPRFEDLRARGRRAYRALRFEEARALWADAHALRPDDAETAADLALAYQHTNENARAIETNREAIRLASSGKLGSDKARRIRRAAYYNLGKLEEGRKLEFVQNNDGPSSCIRIASEPGCAQPMFACAHDGAIGGAHGGFNYSMAQFALTSAGARIVEDGALPPAFDSWVPFGFDEAETHDRSDDSAYAVTLSAESETREPSPGEADVTVASEESGCQVVHVDACAGRLGLYCAWDSWRREGVTAKPRAKAVELTFAPEELPPDP